MESFINQAIGKVKTVNTLTETGMISVDSQSGGIPCLFPGFSFDILC